jgi:hypothetical protein
MDLTKVARLAGCLCLVPTGLVALPQQAITAAMDVEQLPRQTERFVPNVKPEIAAPIQVSEGIKIDGVLDDAEWRRAAVATNFSETFPGDQTQPPIGITALITYDSENLYVGFRIEDDPAIIRASLTDRDNIWQDDYVGLLLDTYASNSWAYFIAANPFGIQGDTRIVQGGNEDLGFNLVFHSEGRITEDGYEVEMAIPFRSLRFPNAETQNWNMNFWITHPRASRSTYSWAAMDRNDPCWLCQFGTMEGIEGIERGNNLELLPALVGGQAGALEDDEDPESEFINESVRLEPSLGVKYAFNPNVVGDLALNPDFSQVESDVAQIDVNTTFALFFPERRPFFQEGSELYETPIQTVYTRSINNPDASGKLTGRFGKSNAAYLGAVDADTPIILPFEEQSGFVDAGRSVSNIARYKKNVGNGSFFGGLMTDRRYSVGGSGTTIGADGLIRVSKNYSIEGQFVASHTAEPNAPDLTEDVEDITFGTDDQYTATFDGETYTGFSSYLSLERDSRFWNFDLDFNTASPTFRADAGFVNRNSVHRVGLWNGFDLRPSAGFIDQITPYFNAGYEWNYNGVRKDEYAWIGFWGRFKGQTNAGANVLLFSNERFKGVDFRGINRVNVWFNSNFSDPVKLGSEFTFGQSIARGEDVPVLGTGLDLSFWGTLRPSSRFQVNPSVSFSKLDHPDTGESIFSGYVGRIRFNYQFTRRFFLRLITQYNDFNRRFEIDPLLTYSVNPYTEFYLGSTHDFTDFDETQTGYTPTARQFFFKVRYLVRT